MPLFHRNEAPIAEATARRAEAAAQFDLVQTQVMATIDLAEAGQRAAALQVARADALRAGLEKQHAHWQQRFEAGGADRLEVETSRLELAATDTAILDADLAAVGAAGQLEDALQIPFPRLEALVASRPNSTSTP